MDVDSLTITIWASEEEKQQRRDDEIKQLWEEWAKVQERALDWTQQKRIQNWEDAR